MTYQLIELNQAQLLFAFRSKERDYLKTLTNRANHLFNLIQNKLASKEEKQEYYSLKWILKQLEVSNEDAG